MTLPAYLLFCTLIVLAFTAGLILGFIVGSK
jgi:hypothetical protein